jgi:hypothetical protein
MGVQPNWPISEPRIPRLYKQQARVFTHSHLPPSHCASSSRSLSPPRPQPRNLSSLSRGGGSPLAFSQQGGAHAWPRRAACTLEVAGVAVPQPQRQREVLAPRRPQRHEQIWRLQQGGRCDLAAPAAGVRMAPTAARWGATR